MSTGERASLEQRMEDAEDRCEGLSLVLGRVACQVRDLEREQDRSKRDLEGCIYELQEQVRDLRRELERVGQ